MASVSQQWMPPSGRKLIEAIDPHDSYYKDCIENEQYNSQSMEWKTNESIKWLDKTLKIAVFNPSNWNGFFFNKRAPKNNDWLNSSQGERDRNGQTFMEWMNTRKWMPNRDNFQIGLISVGDLNIHLNKTKTRNITNLQDILVQFVETFFVLPVKVINSSKIDIDIIEHRTNSNTNLHQLNTGDIMNKFKDIRRWNVGKNLFMLMGMTIYDLYPSEDWNFVFGEATMNKGVGIFSFSRYLPGFYDKLCGKKMLFGKNKTLRNLLKIKETEQKRQNKKKKKKDFILPLNEKEQIIFMRRCMKVLVHEIGHLFHLEHCIYFECIMNGCNHLDENDKQPFYLCPVCLNKFYYARWYRFQSVENGKYDDDVIKAIDILKRYQNLSDLMDKLGLQQQKDWYSNRIQCIQNEEKTEMYVGELIVSGFLRRVAFIFDQTFIIPNSIYIKCYKYYST